MILLSFIEITATTRDGVFITSFIAILMLLMIVTITWVHTRHSNYDELVDSIRDQERRRLPKKLQVDEGLFINPHFTCVVDGTKRHVRVSTVLVGFKWAEEPTRAIVTYEVSDSLLNLACEEYTVTADEFKKTFPLTSQI